MATPKEPGSIFDILGPIMTGPSSSHTAGAVRIGLMARHIVGDGLRRAVITFYGSLAETYKGHMTDSGLVAGLLGMNVDAPGIRQVLERARQNNLDIQVQRLFSEKENPNTIEMDLETKDDKIHRIKGITLGGGEIMISSIDDFPVNLRGKHNEILLFLEPGIAVPGEGMSIAPEVESFVSEGPGGARLLVLSSPAPLDKSKFEGLGNIAGVIRVCNLPRLYDYGKRSGPPLFWTIEEMILYSSRVGGLAEAARNYEEGRSGLDREELRKKLGRIWSIMENSGQVGLSGNNQMIGGLMPGNDGKRLYDAFSAGITLSGSVVPLAIAKAIATMEVNASMGRVCASPTAGSCGVLPGALSAVMEKKFLDKNTLLDALLVAGLYGALIAYRAPVSGALGGCQSEIGVASAMAAAALAHVGGGTAEATAHAMALAMKSLLGLVCDPVAGPVEVPCIKRNAIGVANAFSSADMALAGIRSVIPPDEVIDALMNVQQLMPVELRDTTMGGLGVTRTAERLKAEWFSKCSSFKRSRL